MEIVKQMFSGQEVRALERDGEFWFVAGDVAHVLGLSNVTRSLARLDDDEVALHTVKGEAGAREVNIISESGLYNLILTSRRPEARPFRRWVTHDLLPNLRRTGFYSLREAVATPHAIARAYGVTTRNIAHYMTCHGILPVGTAENPDTGKMVDLYPVAEVQERFMLGSGPRTELRAYTGAWDRVTRPVHIQEVSA